MQLNEPLQSNNCWLSFAIVRLLYDVTMRARVSDFKRILIG